MLEQPVFTHNFGNVKIKIWSYPKDVLRSLIIGMKTNSNTLHKITKVMGFKHLSNKSCNCKDKVEDLCLKFSINAHRYGKVYIPLEIFDSTSPEHQIFLCELISIPDRCKKHISKNINVISESDRNNNCLLKLVANTKNKCRNEDICENHIPTQHRKSPFTESLAQNENNSKDVTQILDLCLKLNIPSQKIMELLRSLKNFQKNKKLSETKCRNCTKSNEMDIENDIQIPVVIDDIHNLHTSTLSGNNNREYRSSNSPFKRTKQFTINRSPSPNTCPNSYNEEYETDYSESLSPDLCSEIQHCLKNAQQNSLSRLRNSKNAAKSQSYSNSMIERDIQDIKCILKEIICLIGDNGYYDHNDQEEPEDMKCEIEPAECKSSHDIDALHALLQEWVKDKNMKENGNKMEYSEKIMRSSDSKANQCEGVDCNKELMLLEEKTRNKIYRYLPQTIPFMPKIQDEYIVPVLDAYDSHKEHTNINDPSEISEFPVNSKTLAIKSALESAGVPPNISEKICQMTLSNTGTGITNIYYYVSGNGAKHSITSNAKENNLYKETEIVIEQQTMKKLNKMEKENLGERYSHVVIDLNNPNHKNEHSNIEPEASPILLDVQNSHESQSNVHGGRRHIKHPKHVRLTDGK